MPASRTASVAMSMVDTRFLRSELWLIFGRRRNWAGLAVLAAVPIVIATALRVSGPEEAGPGGPDFFSLIAGNGFFVALAALTMSLPLFLPVAVAAISGDSVAGEANVGSLRYLLTVPVHRTRVLLVKYAAIVIFTFVATLLIAIVGALVGLAVFGGGPVTLLSGNQIGATEAMLRLAAVCGYIAVGLCALGAIGLFVSTLTEQPIGATITVLIASMTSFILGSIPQLDWLHPYLLTQHWMAFGDLMRDPVVTGELTRGLVTAAAYAIVFCTAAWASFANRDITS